MNEELIEFDLESFVGQQQMEQFFQTKEDKKIVQEDIPERNFVFEDLKASSDEILLQTSWICKCLLENPFY